MRRALTGAGWLAAAVLLAVISAPPAAGQVMGVIRKIDPPEAGFFSKELQVRGIRILAHADVSDAAVDEAARRLDVELSRCPEIAANLVAAGAEMHVIGKDQQVSDLPEHRHLKGKPFDGKKTVDERARGLGGLMASCCEENLLMLPSDRWKDHRDICKHEFAHSILSFGVTRDIRDKVEAQRKKSLAAGKWKGTYAGTNDQEFFAELSMWYFGTRGDYTNIEPPPSPGPQWLKVYDPEAYALLDDIYSGRLVPGKVEARTLKRLGPEAEGKVSSKADQPRATILFVNKTDKPIEKFWLDFEGKRKSYGKLGPGETDDVETFVTHAWLLADEGGKVLGIYVAERGVGRVVIGP